VDINMLSEFLAAAGTAANGSGSFAKAAEELDTSPSALSKHIKLLEEELGSPLFDRTTRRIILTDFGRFFLPYAEALSSKYHESMRAAADYKSRQTTELSFGCALPVSFGPLSDACRAYRGRFPDCVFSICVKDNWKLKTMLREGTVEFILAYAEQNTDEGFLTIPLGWDELIALVPSSHPLGDVKMFRIQDLRSETLLLQPRGSFLGSQICNFCHDAGFDPVSRYHDIAEADLADLTDRGNGISLMMRSAAQCFAGPHSRIVEIDRPLRLQFGISILKGQKLSSAAEQFMTLLREQTGLFRGKEKA